jgi:hypothetical protein
MSKPIYPIQALHKHDMIQNTTIRDHTHCSSTSILPYLSQYNYKKSNKNQWLESSNGKQKGRPKKGQKMHNLEEPKNGKS